MLKRFVFAAIAASAVLGAPVEADVIDVNTSYSFVGTCGDCIGTGVGTLALKNYTVGDDLTNANFDGFTYTSSLTSVSIPPWTLFLYPAISPLFRELTKCS